MPARVFKVRRAWANQTHLRLDASAYGEGVQSAVERIRSRPFKALEAIARIFRGPLHKRVYVTDPARGVPYLTGSDVALVDLPRTVLLSRARTPQLPVLTVQEGWTLVTSAGSIGNCTFVRASLAECVVSQDMIRVAPHELHPGFVFAFLSTSTGRALIRSQTYGSVVDRIEPKHLEDIPVPLPPESVGQYVNDLVTRAASARVRAESLLAEAAAWYDSHTETSRYQYEHALAAAIVNRRSLGGRLDAFNHVGWAAVGALEGPRLGDVAQVQRPGIIRRVEVERGVPFVSGIDVYQVRPRARQRIIRRDAERVDALVTAGTVLVQRSGQRYGLLGRPAYVGRRLDGYACSEDLIRVVPNEVKVAGECYAFLLSDVGRRGMLRHSYGTSIPHLNPDGVRSVTVPSLPEGLANAAARALSLREEADADEATAIHKVEEWLAS